MWPTPTMRTGELRGPGVPMLSATGHQQRLDEFTGRKAREGVGKFVQRETAVDQLPMVAGARATAPRCC